MIGTEWRKPLKMLKLRSAQTTKCFLTCVNDGRLAHEELGFSHLPVFIIGSCGSASRRFRRIILSVSFPQGRSILCAHAAHASGVCVYKHAGRGVLLCPSET